MLFNKNLKNIILNITTIIIIIIILFIIYNLYAKNTNGNKEPFDFFTCTMNLKDIDPRFKDEYMKFDNMHVSCGPCQNATLKMNIMTCPTNANGSPSPNCIQNATIESSLGNSITYPSFVNTQNIKNFFCFEQKQ